MRLYYFCQNLFYLLIKVFRTTAVAAKRVTLQPEIHKLLTAIYCVLRYGFQGSSQHHHITPSLTTRSSCGTYDSMYQKQKCRKQATAASEQKKEQHQSSPSNSLKTLRLSWVWHEIFYQRTGKCSIPFQFYT
jgi:hypothetical protein